MRTELVGRRHELSVLIDCLTLTMAGPLAVPGTQRRPVLDHRPRWAGQTGAEAGGVTRLSCGELRGLQGIREELREERPRPEAHLLGH